LQWFTIVSLSFLTQVPQLGEIFAIWKNNFMGSSAEFI
jgi:hypothetical protein